MSSLSLLQIALLCTVPSLVQGWAAPSYSGYNVAWSDTFAGASGTSPNTNNWNIITGNLGVNGELETYSSSNKNVQCSGGDTLQLVPWRDSSVSGGWTSGRLESKYTFTPVAGRRTFAEAELRFGTNDISTKQGIWPAFWLLGDILRQGGGWPACGELDVMETIDGQLETYSHVHCDVYPGGLCNEGSGLGNGIGLPDQSWHTFRVQWDLTSNNWATESITFTMDGQQVFSISGSQLSESVWATLAHSPVYFIVNVAVGGAWPGYPNDSTLDGYGSMMEVAYVAHYTQA